MRAEPGPPARSRRRGRQRKWLRDGACGHCACFRPGVPLGSVQLVSAFADSGSLAPQQIWAGVLGRSVHGERVTLALIELEANAEVPEHAHVNEQVGILLEGSLRFTIGGEEREFGP